jgi:hypothetical protein
MYVVIRFKAFNSFKYPTTTICLSNAKDINVGNIIRRFVAILPSGDILSRGHNKTIGILADHRQAYPHSQPKRLYL